jgi:hypothetical protein
VLMCRATFNVADIVAIGDGANEKEAESLACLSGTLQLAALESVSLTSSRIQTFA